MEAPTTTARQRGSYRRVTPDITYLRTVMVNVYFVGDRNDWVLVDAGLPATAGMISQAAEKRFGRGRPPRAIVLTHGHFDHVGGLRELAEYWDVPVYAHRLELPYLDGSSAYPPPDRRVGGGLMARLAPFYPRGPIDIGDRLQELPAGGDVPQMPGWRWLHTPGHTAGHVSLFRDSDRTLIAGDAFITVNQESALDVVRQHPEVSGPPAYYTQDWREAERSVEKLHSLNPELALTGHGVPLRGEQLERGLERLVHDFVHLAVPKRGRYVRQPAVADEAGVVSVPPVPRRVPVHLLGWGALGLTVGLAAWGRARKSRSENRR